MALQETVAPSLAELAATANREHALATQAGGAMVEHAIRAGDALLAVEPHIAGGQWEAWVSENFDDSLGQARVYMRLARHQDEIRANKIETIKAARQHLAQIGAPIVRKGAKPRLPDWMRDEAKTMHEQGASTLSIAKELGVSAPTVTRWVDPKQARRAAEIKLRCRREARAAVKAERERKQNRETRQAVKKVGGAMAEAWAMAERLQDVLAQAQRETEDREAREALSRAGTHYRKMRDEIVRAAGVQ